MIFLHTNRTEYANDIADEIRLFFDEEINLPSQSREHVVNSGKQIVATLNRDDRAVYAQAQVDYEGKTQNYSYVLPFPSEISKQNEDSEPNISEIELNLMIKRFEKRAIKIAVYRALKAFTGVVHPWGSLTGIRPTRLLRELVKTEGSCEATRRMTEEFDVSPQKLKLAEDINAVQAPVLNSQTPKDIDIYIGIPFCASRCLYCSFASEIRTQKTDMEVYLNALKKDITLGAKLVFESKRSVRSMYIGGGTPTVLSEAELESLIGHALFEYGGFGRELTVEAGRPDTITAEKLKIIKRYGAGRISINPQTMNDKTLKLVGRNHTSKDIENAYNMARNIGFSSINMDIIIGLPNEGEAEMENTLAKISTLAPDNLTVHTLAIKRASRLKIENVEYDLPSADVAERMVNAGKTTAEALGMNAYYMYRQKYMRGNLENVGYAMPQKECIYNIDMMEDTTCIMSHGAGAMTKAVFDAARRVERIPAPKNIETYINKTDELHEKKRSLFL